MLLSLSPLPLTNVTHADKIFLFYTVHDPPAMIIQENRLSYIAHVDVMFPRSSLQPGASTIAIFADLLEATTARLLSSSLASFAPDESKASELVKA